VFGHRFDVGAWSPAPRPVGPSSGGLAAQGRHRRDGPPRAV